MSDQRYTDALLANGKLREERDQLREALTKTEAEINATSVRFHEVNVRCVAQMMADNDQLRAKYEELDRASERELAATVKEWEACEAENDRLREALTSARTMLVAFGGDPRGSVNGDEIQAAILNLIDAALTKEAGE